MHLAKSDVTDRNVIVKVSVATHVICQCLQPIRKMGHRVYLGALYLYDRSLGKINMYVLPPLSDPGSNDGIGHRLKDAKALLQGTDIVLRCAWGGTVALTPSGARLKAMRKSLHQAIGTRAADSNFNSIKEVEASKFLVRLLNGPDRLFRDIRMYVNVF